MHPARFQKQFLRRLGDFRPLQQLLDLLPDVAFFMKDRSGRFVFNNQRATESCGVAAAAETIGKTDGDFFSPDRAALYRQQDQQVMQGTPILNAICPAPEKGADWLIIFSKVPLKDRRGRIIGVAGIHREIRGLPAAPPQYNRISRAIQRMHQHYAAPLSIAALAAESGLSRSQLDRCFRRLFRTTPRDYLLRLRINAASRLLAETNRKTTDIALEVGFYDHAHFSRTFRKLTGVTPAAYRKRHHH
ncbi:MAG: AraC family transcriptional regulator [Verrucomicrobia bacterium]|nr:AraC family transcriptional regulator [Verrucomicrobiota bacterium]